MDVSGNMNVADILYVNKAPTDISGNYDFMGLSTDPSGTYTYWAYYTPDISNSFIVNTFASTTFNYVIVGGGGGGGGTTSSSQNGGGGGGGGGISTGTFSTSIGTSTYNITIGGGGTGGPSSGGSTNGGDSYIYNDTSVVANATGGGGGNAGNTGGGGSGGPGGIGITGTIYS
jgi:hypothetical protein